MTGHLITSTTLLEIKSMPKDTLMNQYATKTKPNAKSCKAKYSVQIAWVEEKRYILILYCVTLRRLSLVPTCPKNRKNRGFLRFSDVSDSYDQWEHRIPDIPDGRRFLRRDRKNRKHFYCEGVHPRRSPTSTSFKMSVDMKFACLGHRDA